MDIHNINNLYQATKSLPSQKTDKDKGFKQIFNQELTEIQAAPPQIPLDSRRDVLDQGDKILHLLNDYARELADPAKTLKDIEPLVEGIRKEASLIGAAEKAYNDTELERIIKDVTITANVAISKFQRGDYV